MGKEATLTVRVGDQSADCRLALETKELIVRGAPKGPFFSGIGTSNDVVGGVGRLSIARVESNEA